MNRQPCANQGKDSETESNMKTKLTAKTSKSNLTQTQPTSRHLPLPLLLLAMFLVPRRRVPPRSPAPPLVVLGGPGLLRVGGAVPGTGDTVIIATTGAGAVSIAATLTQTAAGSVTVNNGATLSMTTSGMSVTLGALTNNGTITAYRDMTVLGNTAMSGTINFGSTSGTQRTMTFTGDVALNSGTVWNETTTGTAAAFSFGGSLANKTPLPLLPRIPRTRSLDRTRRSAEQLPLPSQPPLSPGATIIRTVGVSTALTVTGGTVGLTNTGTVTATASLAGTGNLVNQATSVLNVQALLPLPRSLQPMPVTR